MSDYHSGLATGMAMSGGNCSGLLKDLDTQTRNLEGTRAVRDALVKALAEVAPNHPLLSKEERNKIAYQAAGWELPKS